MPELTHGQGQDLIDAFKRAWESRDPDLAVSLFRDDAEYREDPFREPLKGANAIRAMWNEVAATQAHVEFDAERIWVSGSTVLSSWHAAFTRRTNGERVRVRGFMTLELEGGKVTRLREWSTSRVVGHDSTLARHEYIADGDPHGG